MKDGLLRHGAAIPVEKPHLRQGNCLAFRCGHHLIEHLRLFTVQAGTQVTQAIQNRSAAYPRLWMSPFFVGVPISRIVSAFSDMCELPS